MPAANKPDFSNSAADDRTRFLAEFVKQFSDSPRYNAGASQDMPELLGLIERDRDITDIRWAAYMLATTMWETTCPQKVERPALNRKGKPLRDKKGRPVMLKTRKSLISMAPVEEIGHGRGRQYHEPVKVKLLPDGTARVTEHDGDQFRVKSDGTILPLTPSAKLGAKDGGGAVTGIRQ